MIVARQFAGGTDDRHRDPVPEESVSSTVRVVADCFSSREAAQECSPQLALSLSKGRKPWVRSGKNISPEGAQDGLRHRFRRDK